MLGMLNRLHNAGLCEYSLPGYVKEGSRLHHTELVLAPSADISAMELFAASNVNADPFMVMRKLKRAILKGLASDD